MQDIIIIGSGVIGCSIARELSKYDLAITVIEKHDDVASEVSKANSGIIHGGYNETAGTLKAKLCLEGNHMFDELTKELDVTFLRNGALLVAFDDTQTNQLNKLLEQGTALGVPNLSVLSKEEALNIEPNLSPQIVAALNIPTSGIVNPYELTIALAENAAVNGVNFLFNSEVVGIEKESDGSYKVITNNGKNIHGRIIINAAGLYSDQVASLLGTTVPAITPVKGEYCLFNKIVGGKINKTIFQVPANGTKGVLVTKTSDGNLLVGPDAITISDKSDVTTSKKPLVSVLDTGEKSVPGLPVSGILTTFSGLRPKIKDGDFYIKEDASHPGVIHLVGIDSPGLTAAPAIARYVADMVNEIHPLTADHLFQPIRKRIPMFTAMTKDEKNALIKEKPAYGKIICKCELITEGEIIEAIHRPLGARSIDSIKRRTRATLGGCQGLGCLYPISKILSRELNIPLSEVMKNEAGTNAIGFKEEK